MKNKIIIIDYLQIEQSAVCLTKIPNLAGGRSIITLHLRSVVRCETERPIK